MAVAVVDVAAAIRCLGLYLRGQRDGGRSDGELALKIQSDIPLWSLLLYFLY
jgi:hypothetical protein